MFIYIDLWHERRYREDIRTKNLRFDKYIIRFVYFYSFIYFENKHKGVSCQLCQ